jgi:hypothetical protein
MEVSKRKIVVSEQFLTLAVNNTAKVFLMDVVFRAKDDVISPEEYSSLCLLYIPMLKADEKLLPPEFLTALITNPETNAVSINRDNLKQLGLTIQEKKVETYDIKAEDLSKLLASYNEVRNICLSKREGKDFAVQPVPFDPKQMKHYHNIIKFFEQTKIEDWFLFFYTIHMANKWAWIYSLPQCCTAKVFNVYFNSKDRAQAEIDETRQRIKEQAADQKAKDEGSKASVWFAYYPHIEELKKDLVITQSKPEICFNRSQDLLGYNPKSNTCNACPLKGTCADTLRKFFMDLSKSTVDILPLRWYYGTPDFKSVLDQARQTLAKEGSTFSFY